MSENEARDEMEQWDPLGGAVEGDGANDVFRRASDEVDDALGLKDADQRPVPQDEAAVDDTMP